MTPRVSLALCATAAIVGLTAGSGPARAQTDQPQAAAGRGGLEEIVVTARRREERVQTVPLAITAFSQADVEEKHITQISDLMKNVPSLSSAQDNSDANGFYSGQIRLRGLPGTVVYFNEVPLGDVDFNPASGITHGTSVGFFYDLDHLEIDKGPQGTLFGKNSVGGLISIEPKRPTNDYEGYLRVAFGNYADKEVEGAVNIPVIADKLLVRVAGQMQKRDGYTKDISNGVDYDNRDYYSWRVGVTLRPSDDLENYFLYDGYWQDTNGGATIPAYLNAKFPLTGLSATFTPVPTTIKGKPNPACVYTVTLAASGAGGVPGGCQGPQALGYFGIFPTLPQIFAEQQQIGPRAVTGRSVQGLGKDYFYGFSNTTTWDIADNLTLKNIAAARIFKSLSTADDVANPLPVLNIGYPGNQVGWNDNSVQYTEEIQLQGKALNDKLAWVFGGYLEFDHPLGDTVDASSAVGNPSYYHFHQVSRSQAVFAHGIYDLGDYVEGLRLTGGYRYTWDYFSLSERGTNGVDAVTRTDGVGNNCAEIAIFDRNCESATNAHFSSYGWNVSLDDQITPNTLVYVRSGNAYRGGGINPQVPPPYQQIKPEHVTDVEIGVKSDWDFMGVHGRTNFDMFHTDYKAIQVTELVQVTDAQGNKHAASLEANAASAELEGMELEQTFIPFKDVEFSPHAAYLYTHYDQYPAAFKINGSAPPFFYDPKWTWGFTATYHLPIDESWGDASVSATYTFNGQQYVAAAGQDIYPIQPSFDNLDIRVEWNNILNYSVDAAFFMTNATDNLHVQAVLPLYNVLGFTSLVYNEPRMFGVSLKYRFGADKSEPETPAAPYAPPPAAAVAPAPKSYLVFFDFNKSDLTSQATQIVDQAASNAGPAKVTRLTVTGHTDTVGSDAYNMRLSRRRAESVAARLEKDGIASSEIEIVAKGKRDLLVPTADGVREPQNRRVQIVYDGGAAS